MIASKRNHIQLYRLLMQLNLDIKEAELMRDRKLMLSLILKRNKIKALVNNEGG